MMPATVSCPSCGTTVGGEARFCANCGSGVGAAARAESAPPQSALPRSAKSAIAPSPEKSDPLLERLRTATVGEYELYGELGRGGMAAVYLAYELALDRKVAIKVMLPDLVAGNSMAERFKREARTAGALSHPNIIPIHAVKQDDEGMVYFVMKFVEGRGLDSVIRELGQLPILMVQTILAQVAGALAHAHRKNVIHRDIKPANIMIDEDGWAVVTDFGIAKVQDAANLTATDAAIGTPYYMSPEHGSGKPVSGASDQYSLGIMGYEMLTARTPFNGPGILEVMSGHFFETPAPIRTLRRDCPPILEAAVMRMLEKAPADRFPSLDDVVAVIAAPLLAHDDPVRTQMMTLARSTKTLQPRLSVPISPVPLDRKPKVASKSQLPAPLRPSLGERVRDRPKTAVGLLLLLGALGTGYGMELSRRRDAAGSAPPVTASSVRTPAVGSLDPAVDGSARVAAVLPDPKPTPAVTRVNASQLSAREARRLRDSLAKSGTDASALPPRPPFVVPDSGGVLLGTPASSAILYVDRVARPGIFSALRTISLRNGLHHIAINAEGCTAWDTTLTVRGGETAVIGRRSPRCP